MMSSLTEVQAVCVSAAFVPFGAEVFQHEMISAVRLSVSSSSYMLHRESFSLLPPLSPYHHPSLHLVLPPPRWELCNTLQGCQERGTKGKLCVHIYICVCVYAWWRGRWMEKEREIRVYLRAKKAARDFAYKPSSSFIHHSHPPSHILRFSLLFYQGRRQGRSSHISWPVIGCHSGAGL